MTQAVPTRSKRLVIAAKRTGTGAHTPVGLAFAPAALAPEAAIQETAGTNTGSPQQSLVVVDCTPWMHLDPQDPDYQHILAFAKAFTRRHRQEGARRSALRHRPFINEPSDRKQTP